MHCFQHDRVAISPRCAVATRSLLHVDAVVTVFFALLLIGGVVTFVVWLEQRMRQAAAERLRQWAAAQEERERQAAAQRRGLAAR